MRSEDGFVESDMREEEERNPAGTTDIENVSNITESSSAIYQRIFEGGKLIQELKDLTRMPDKINQLNETIIAIQNAVNGLTNRVKSLESVAKANIPPKTIEDIKTYLFNKVNESKSHDGSLNPHSFHGILNRLGALKFFTEVK